MKSLIFLLLLFPFAIKAQNCVEIKNSITGKVDKTGIVKMFSSNSSVLTFVRQGDDMTVNYVITVPKYTRTFAADSLHVLFEFSNGAKRDISSSKFSKIYNDSTSVGTFIVFVSDKINTYFNEFKTFKIISIALVPDANHSVKDSLSIPEGLSEVILRTANCVSE